MAEMKHRFMDRAMDLIQQPDWQSRRSAGLIKLILSSLWNHLSLHDKQKFMACLDENLIFSAPEKTPKDMQSEADLGRVLNDWPLVLDGLDGAELAFARDVLGKRRLKWWTPSDKQRAWIMKIWAARHVPDMEVVE